MAFLSPEEVAQFNEQGYLVKPGFLSSTECADLRNEIVRLIREELDLSTHPGTAFSTGADQSSDAYFLSSGDKVAFFFEKGAIDAQGKLTVASPIDGINKVGHALHILSEPFKKVTSRPEVKEAAKALGFKDCRVIQSMAILKPRRLGGEVVPHADSTFLYTDPPSAIGIWIPTEKCTTNNGCLWFWPGSHKNHPISQRFVRDPNKIGTMFIETGEKEGPAPREEDWVPVTCEAGDMVLIHGSAIHKSEHNHSDNTRYAYTFHMIEGPGGGAKYPADNWLQNSDGSPFTELYKM